MEQNSFFAKLCELDQDDQLMHDCLTVCQSLNPQALHEEIAKIRRTYDDINFRLEDYVRHSRSPAISALANAQKTYYQTVKQLTEQELPVYLHSELSFPGDEQSEAGMLYAEYAIDFARQSIYHALLCVLSAIDMEHSIGEQPKHQEGCVE